MLEKEIKILEVNKNDLIERLEKFGATKTFEDQIYDVYYDYPENQIDVEKRSFRIRKKGNCYLYTIKKKEKSETIKICQEKEVEITNLDGFIKTLGKYWLVKTREKVKHRTSYRLWEIEFDIDEYDSMPTLLEIEAKNDEEINLWIVNLWLQNHKRKTFWSRWLFEYYNLAYKNL